MIMLRNLLPYAAALLFVSFCLPIQADFLLIGLPQSDTITIPFANRNEPASWIPLDVMLNGKGPYPFIFDSGFYSNAVVASVVEEIGLKPYKEVRIGNDGKKNVRAGVVRFDSIKLGETSLSDTFCTVPPLPKEVPCRGIIGATLLARCVVTVDYEHRNMILSNPQTFVYHGRGFAMPIEFSREDMRPIVTCTVDGITGRFVIDTGDDAALILYAGFIKANNLQKKYASNLGTTDGTRVTGKEKYTVTNEPDLTLRGCVLAHVPTRLQDPKDGTETQVSGAIGGDILRRFNITLDYRHKCAYFETNKNYAAPYLRQHH